MAKKRIAVLLSGRGSNFMAILDAVERGRIGGEISLVVSDNAEAKGLDFAHKKGLAAFCLLKTKEESRSEYFERIIALLEERRIDLIVLAGFMKVLSPNIIVKFKYRIINIHPALLPSFPGTHAQKQAVDYGVRVSGCTVHFVDEGVDTGPVILQEAVPVLPHDTEQTLSERILEKEHVIFPEAVRLFCEGRLDVKGRRVAVNP
jgi:phosphoribosylglycinamide formyltransferase 1